MCRMNAIKKGIYQKKKAEKGIIYRYWGIIWFQKGCNELNLQKMKRTEEKELLWKSTILNVGQVYDANFPETIFEKNMLNNNFSVFMNDTYLQD